MNLPYNTNNGVEIGRTENLMDASNSFSNPIMPNEPPPTLGLRPINYPFLMCPQTRDVSASNHEFQMQTYDTNTSMTARDEVDLELRLG